MSQQIQLICDTCGRLRGPSNHWLMLWTFGNLFTNIKTEDTAFIKKDFCGSVCLLKEVARLIDAANTKSVNFEQLTEVLDKISTNEAQQNRRNFLKGLDLKDAIK